MSKHTPGGGAVDDKAKALLLEIMAKVNVLFDGEFTDDDTLVKLNNVPECGIPLAEQAANNTEEPFSNSL